MKVNTRGLNKAITKISRALGKKWLEILSRLRNRRVRQFGCTCNYGNSEGGYGS